MREAFYENPSMWKRFRPIVAIVWDELRSLITGNAVRNFSDFGVDCMQFSISSHSIGDALGKVPRLRGVVNLLQAGRDTRLNENRLAMLSDAG
jgi:hypothetical protein